MPNTRGEKRRGPPYQAAHLRFGRAAFGQGWFGRQAHDVVNAQILCRETFWELIRSY
jgi:hypothetical protein